MFTMLNFLSFILEIECRDRIVPNDNYSASLPTINAGATIHGKTVGKFPSKKTYSHRSYFRFVHRTQLHYGMRDWKKEVDLDTPIVPFHTVRSLTVIRIAMRVYFVREFLPLLLMCIHSNWFRFSKQLTSVALFAFENIHTKRRRKTKHNDDQNYWHSKGFKQHKLLYL